IRRCSHRLPLSRHSSQPSALGVTFKMPAIWLQLFAVTASHLGRFGEMHLDAAGCEYRQIRRGSLSFRAGESRLDRRHIIEAQHRDQMKVGGSARCCDRTVGDPVFPQARELLRERDVTFEIVFVEGRGIIWSFVEHDEISQGVSPLLTIRQFRITPHYSAGFAASPRKPCNAATTCAPSPIAPPTRLTDPERTSPTANTPGTVVSSCATGRPFPSAGTPVSTNPARSTLTPQPSSQLVAGSAPTNKNRLRISSAFTSGDSRLRQRTHSSEASSLPFSPITSALKINSIFGVASMRSIR